MSLNKQTEEMAGQFCLNDDQLVEITHITKQVEALYGHSVDIEFKDSKWHIYLLPSQTRLPRLSQSDR
ncbi:PEP/pyruvate-binding domain-containing protein [Bacillus sp. SL00103]